MESRQRRRPGAATLAWMLAVSLCACARRPVPVPVAIIPDTTPAEIHVTGAPSSEFGAIVAYGIGFASGAPSTYQVSGARVFAIDRAGHRVAPLSVDEAIREGGGAHALVAGLEGGAGGALLAGIAGVVPGAILGAASSASHAGTGAAVGAAIGFTVGALTGFFDARKRTEEQAAAQLRDLALGDHALKPGIPVSGFVFYPKGTYVAVRAVVVEEQTQQPLEVRGEIVERDV